MPRGQVKWFDPKKGYGFIFGPEGQDVFVHYSHIQADGFRALASGSIMNWCRGTRAGSRARCDRSSPVRLPMWPVVASSANGRRLPRFSLRAVADMSALTAPRSRRSPAAMNVAAMSPRRTRTEAASDVDGLHPLLRRGFLSHVYLLPLR